MFYGTGYFGIRPIETVRDACVIISLDGFRCSKNIIQEIALLFSYNLGIRYNGFKIIHITFQS